MEEISSHSFVLTPGRYVGAEDVHDDDEPFAVRFQRLASIMEAQFAEGARLETAIRENLRAFIDTGFTAHHDVTEFWDSPGLKVFRGVVTMRPDDPTQPTVRPVMTHFFYTDETGKVTRWIGVVGPVAF